MREPRDDGRDGVGRRERHIALGAGLGMIFGAALGAIGTGMVLGAAAGLLKARLAEGGRAD